MSTDTKHPDVPLPEPAMMESDPYCGLDPCSPDVPVLSWFSAAQLHAYGQACADAALERAASEFDGRYTGALARSYSEALRAMKGST